VARSRSNPRGKVGVLIGGLIAGGMTLGGCLLQEETGGESDEQGFVALFDGSSLEGWVQVLDSEWRVKEGALTSRQDPAGRREGESWLFTEEDYTDFVLRLEFRVTPGGNSGVFLRDPISRAERLEAEDGGPPPWEAGYEVNLNAREPNYPTGSVWAAAGGRPGREREGGWNTLEVRLEGQTISTWVNGRPALEDIELPERSTRGGIGFQRHGGAAYRDKLVEFRNVRIREL